MSCTLQLLLEVLEDTRKQLHVFDLEEWDFDSTTDLAPNTPEVGSSM